MEFTELLNIYKELNIGDEFLKDIEDLDYDFLADEKDRLQAKANVMQRWKGQKNLRKSIKQDALLLQSSGGLDQQNFDRLLRWRDDRNVFLSE